MKKISTWLYIGSGVSLFLVYAVWFYFKGTDMAYAERFGTFIGLWVPTLLIAGKIMEDRGK
ncbi:MAG: hypothetical protein WC947_04415 [Elusimicrobiota bacterium]